jgi:predicted transglutaminase-like cysteine proteinase
MKKILSMLVVLVVMVSSLSAVTLFQYRHPMLTTQAEILRWVADEIIYIAEPLEGEVGYKVRDDWKTPEETLLSRSGDCEDFTILLMYLLDLIGVKTEMALVLMDADDEDGDGDLGGHAFILIDGVAYEPQRGGIVKYDYKLLYTMTYLETMYIAYSY